MAGPSQLIQIELHRPLRQPKPEWLRAKAPVGDNFHNLKKLARGLGLHTVCESAQCPNIGECWNHNTETVPRLYRAVRSGARYERTLRLLEQAKEISPGMVTKSGVMVGLGEESAELIEVFRDLGSRGVDILTVGQYLRPSKDHLPIARFYTPDEFQYLKAEALRFGFAHVESGPMVRSSYHAHEQAESTSLPMI